MKFKKYMTELSMKKGTGFEIKKSATEFLVYITLENYDEYLFFADYDSINDSWEVEFERQGSGIMRVKVDRKTVLELFAALEKAFTEFLKIKKPNSFTFSGSQDKVSLYDTIAKKITKRTKYKMEKEPDPTGGMIYFFDR